MRYPATNRQVVPWPLSEPRPRRRTGPFPRRPLPRVPPRLPVWRPPPTPMPRYPLPPARGPMPITSPPQVPIPGGLGGLVIRGAGRLVPWIGVGMLAYDVWRWWQGRQGLDMRGWEVTVECGERPDYPQRFAYHPTYLNYCGNGGIGTINNGYGTPQELLADRPNSHAFGYWQERSSISSAFVRKYEKVSEDAHPEGPIEVNMPSAYLPPVMPYYPPWIDPLQMPINQPMPTPVPPPYRWIPRRRPNPYRSPTEQSQRGNRVETAPTPRPYARPRPAGRGTKERKVLSSVATAVLTLWSAATEVPDWVDAFYDALPEELREAARREFEGKPNVSIRAYMVYRYFEYVDLNQALQNSLWNIIEDATAGEIHRLLRKAGLGVGFQGQAYVRQDFLR